MMRWSLTGGIALFGVAVVTGCAAPDVNEVQAASYRWRQVEHVSPTLSATRTGVLYGEYLTLAAQPSASVEGFFNVAQERSISTEQLAPDGGVFQLNFSDFDGGGIPRTLHAVRDGVVVMEVSITTSPFGGGYVVDSISFTSLSPSSETSQDLTRIWRDRNDVTALPRSSRDVANMQLRGRTWTALAVMQDPPACDPSQAVSGIQYIGQSFAYAYRLSRGQVPGPLPLPMPSTGAEITSVFACASAAGKAMNDAAAAAGSAAVAAGTKVSAGSVLWSSVIGASIAEPIREFFRRREAAGGESAFLGGSGAIRLETCKKYFKKSVCERLARLNTN